jgi:hypothetical protein
MGELLRSQLAPVNSEVAAPGVFESTTRVGMSGQLSVFLPTKGESGLELAGRYATFDDATTVDDNGDVGILHAGATFRDLLPRIDLGAGVVHRAETAAIQNDTVHLWLQARPDKRF